MLNIISHQEKEKKKKNSTMTYYFIPTWMAIIKNTETSKGWQRCGKSEPSYTATRM